MRPLYRFVLVLLLVLMFRTPIFRLFQTSQHLVKATTRRLDSQPLTANMSDRPTGLIANKGLELLTFGTPNGQ